MRSFIVPANFFPSVCFVLTVMGVAMTQPIGIAADAAPAPGDEGRQAGQWGGVGGGGVAHGGAR